MAEKSNKYHTINILLWRISNFKKMRNNSVHQKPDVKIKFQVTDSLLTPEASQERITLLLIIFSFILSFFFGLLFVWVLYISSGIKELVILEPDLSKPQVIGFPIPHFGILDRLGTLATFISPLLDPTYEKFISLTKIPKARQDISCASDKDPSVASNILMFLWHSDIFFLHTDSERPMIRFETLTNRHRTIGKSSIPDYQKYFTKGNMTEK